MNNNYLEHHGILGQKWGVRRFQNKDGSYTAEGRKRHTADGDSLPVAALRARGEGKKEYVSSKTKKAIRAKEFGEKMDAKTRARYEKKTGKKYIEDDEDRQIKAAREAKVKANQELDKKVQEVRDQQSTAAKIGKYSLYGHMGAEAYDTLKATKGYSSGEAYVTEVMFGTLGSKMIANKARQEYVKAEVDKAIEKLEKKTSK